MPRRRALPACPAAPAIMPTTTPAVLPATTPAARIAPPGVRR
ncbi:hypothetical protein ACFVUH_12865 [Kitasatospora sp. NPDC058032]